MRRRLLTALLTSLALVGCGTDAPPAGKADDKQAKQAEQAKQEQAKDDDEQAKAPTPQGPDAKPATDPAAKPELAEAPPTDPTAPPTAAGGAPTTIEVLSTGSEPRRELRFGPSAGQTETMVLVMTMEITIDMGPGAPIPATTQTTPKITMYNTSTVEKVAEGRIEQKVVFDRYEMGEAEGAAAMMATAMSQAFDQMKGFEQRMAYDTRGVVLEGDWTVPPGMDPQLASNLQNVNQSLEQAMLRFPVEAVGVGAKWKEISEIDSNGLKIEQTAEYTVDAIADNAISVSTVISQAPKSKKLSAPNMPAGVEVDLLEFDSKGSGKIELELDHMIPRSGSSTMDTSLTVEAGMGDQKQKVTTKIKMNLEISRQDAAPAAP